MESTSPAGALILVVDDDPTMCALLRLILGSASYTIITALSAEAALAHIAQTPPQLVLTDMQLTGMGGIDLCRALRANLPANKIAIMLMSVSDDPYDQKLARDAGADDFLVKPFSPAQLLDHVAALLARPLS